jgi:hypothetical protein
MTGRLKAVAALAAWLALGVSAQAQTSNATPVGAARMIEPIGYNPHYQPPPPPDLMPGPVTPSIAPAGPPESLWLRSSHSSAFQCEEFPTEQACYGSIGGMGLARYHPGHMAIALDEYPFTLKNGLVPPGRLPTALDVSTLNPTMWVGARATVGYLCGDEAIEVTGFYQPPQSNSKQVVGPGRFLVPYFTPSSSFPAGFEGDNGLWNHADQVAISYQTNVGSAELNYRRWDIAVNGMELILGVRYFFTRENLSQYTNDDALTTDAFGLSNPRLAATYSVTTRNNILGPQVGGEYSFAVPWTCDRFWFTVMGKAMAGANWEERHWSLTRGDLLKAFDIYKYSVEFSQVYEVNAMIDWHVLERFRIRVGYTALWAVGITNPANQFDFNLAQQGFKHPDKSSAFWHGPIAELQFLW